VTRILAALAISAIATLVRADATGLLYDPQPPANSAYVRIVNAAPGATVDVAVDGRPRLRAIAAGAASDYMVLAAGRRSLAIGPSGKPAVLKVDIDAAAGRAITIAFGRLAADAKPWTFEDRANTNKLKAVVAVYHLAENGDPIDVATADGATKVFTGIAPGTSAGRAVNPVKADLVATRAGASARASLAMEPGGTYSVLVYPGADGRLVAHALLNKVERYTGREAPAK
jgi:alginate O-acetyltransferase complex protein AlgF